MFSPFDPVTLNHTAEVFQVVLEHYANYVRNGGDPGVPASHWESIRELADRLASSMDDDNLPNDDDACADIYNALYYVWDVVTDEDVFDGMMTLADVDDAERDTLYQAGVRLMVCHAIQEVKFIHDLVHKQTFEYRDCSQDFEAIQRLLNAGQLVPLELLMHCLDVLPPFLKSLHGDRELREAVLKALRGGEDEDDEEDDEEDGDGDEDGEYDGYLAAPQWREASCKPKPPTCRPDNRGSPDDAEETNCMEEAGEDLARIVACYIDAFGL